MKSSLPRAGTLLAAMAILAAPTAATAQNAGSALLGLWNTGSEGGKVEIYRCGPAYCGKIADAARLRADPNLRDIRNKNPSLRDRRLKGLVVLQSFGGGPTTFKGGPVYDPESGDAASRGELRLLPSGALEVKGCVAFFCRTKLWTKIG